ncbi:MAG: uroporphyrinogen decarboxylase family protein [Candidatus Helarchaeota archaeon]
MALNKETPDRVPYLELGMDAYVLAQIATFQDYWPCKLKQWLDGLHIYEETVKSAREHYGIIHRSKSKSIIRKVLPIDALTGSLLQQPTTYEFLFFASANFIPHLLRLGVDGTLIFGFPGIMRGWAYKEFNGKKHKFLVNESYVLHDIDEWGNIRAIDVLYSDPEVQMEKYIENLKTNDFQGKLWLHKKIEKKWGKSKLLIPGIMGFFETWHQIYGLSHMNKFFSELYKEYRKGHGPYLNLLDEALKFYCKLVDVYAEAGIEAVCLLEDCATSHGPMIPPDMYRKIYTPRIKKFVDYAHNKRLRVMFHTDGRMKMPRKEKPWDFMDAIVESGIDGFHGCQADVNNLYELKERYGEKICLIGGISCVEVAQYAKSPKEVYTAVAETFKALKPGGNYIAANDNGLHWGVNIYNIRAIARAVRFYGKY